MAFTDTKRLIGDAAKNQVAMNPNNTVFDAKCLIDCDFNDQNVQMDMKHWPFKVINVGTKPKIQVDFKCEEKTFTPEEVSSMVLTKVKETAEQYLGKLNQLIFRADSTKAIRIKWILMLNFHLDRFVIFKSCTKKFALTF